MQTHIGRLLLHNVIHQRRPYESTPLLGQDDPRTVHRCNPACRRAARPACVLALIVRHDVVYERAREEVGDDGLYRSIWLSGLGAAGYRGHDGGGGGHAVSRDRGCAPGEMARGIVEFSAQREVMRQDGADKGNPLTRMLVCW